MARLFLLLAGVFAGYLMVLRLNPARASLRDGARCLRRYPQIWGLPVAFGLCHSAFTLWLRWQEARLIPNGPPLIQPWLGWAPPAWLEIVPSAWLPASEGAAAVFNCLVTAFPLSAICALQFLLNWRGYQRVVWRGLKRRFGGIAASVLHAAFVLMALAAVAKPFLYGGLIGLNAYFGEAILLRGGEVINWLSFLFEYLVGVGVQIYLILLCYAWIRGLTFDFEGLRRFALRRFAFVMRWALVVMALSSLGINLPLMLASFSVPAQGGAAAWVEPTVQIARGGLALVLLIFCSMQILLIFHNETLGAALSDHARLWRHYGLHVGWLIVVAFLHFFLLALAHEFLFRALGRWTLAGTCWNLVAYPVLWAMLGSWLLASWVCLFKRCETHRPEAEELVRF